MLDSTGSLDVQDVNTSAPVANTDIPSAAPSDSASSVAPAASAVVAEAPASAAPARPAAKTYTTSSASAGGEDPSPARPRLGARRPYPSSQNRQPLPPMGEAPVSGFIDLTLDGHAVVRPRYAQSRNDAYLSISIVRKLGLRAGDWVEGIAREPRENDRYWGMKDITKVNGLELGEIRNRRRFEDMVPVYPDEKITLETEKEPLSTRLIDLVAPIGKGQRGLIVSPPKAGKTSIIKDIATGVAKNYPDLHLMAVLIGERPEEVTDIARHISAITDGKGETAASNFDEPAEEQTRIAEVALERAKRLVEEGKDVVIVLDSITRLARAYNLAIPTSGRTLSGGFDPAALYPPKRFFGAARNFEVAGSLTIIGTALVDTGSRMDDLVYEEFKGTGNMELHLDRRLAERRVYPAINLQRSGTRRDDLLFDNSQYQSILVLHRMIDMLGEDERTEVVIRRLKETPNNKQFLASLKEG